jgi:hypothetical protein
MAPRSAAPPPSAPDRHARGPAPADPPRQGRPGRQGELGIPRGKRAATCPGRVSTRTDPWPGFTASIASAVIEMLAASAPAARWCADRHSGGDPAHGLRGDGSAARAVSAVQPTRPACGEGERRAVAGNAGRAACTQIPRQVQRAPVAGCTHCCRRKVVWEPMPRWDIECCAVQHWFVLTAGRWSDSVGPPAHLGRFLTELGGASRCRPFFGAAFPPCYGQRLVSHRPRCFAAISPAIHGALSTTPATNAALWAERQGRPRQKFPGRLWRVHSRCRLPIL